MQLFRLKGGEGLGEGGMQEPENGRRRNEEVRGQKQNNEGEKGRERGGVLE